jgi:hypothetical protein
MRPLSPMAFFMLPFNRPMNTFSSTTSMYIRSTNKHHETCHSRDRSFIHMWKALKKGQSLIGLENGTNKANQSVALQRRGRVVNISDDM